MAVELKNVARLAVRQESVFGADESALTFLDVPAREMPTVALNAPGLQIGSLQQHVHGYSGQVLGPRAAELSFDILLAGVGGSSTTSPAIGDSALLTILDAVFGSSDDANDNGEADGTGDATSFGLTVAPSGLGFSTRGAFGWVNAAGVLEARSLRVQSATNVAGESDLSAAPVATDVIWNATSFASDGSNTKTLQFLFEDESGRYIMQGCQLSGAPRLTMGLGELPVLSLTFTGATWTRLGSATVTPASYTQSPDYVDGGFRVVLDSTTYALDVATAEYTLRGPAYTPISSPNGVQTIAGWKMSRSPEGIGDVSFTFPREDDIWEDAWFAGSYVHLEHQAGTSARKTWLVEVGNAQIIGWEPVDQNGLAYQRVTVRADIDSDATPAALRIHHV